VLHEARWMYRSSANSLSRISAAALGKAHVGEAAPPLLSQNRRLAAGALYMARSHKRCIWLAATSAAPYCVGRAPSAPAQVPPSAARSLSAARAARGEPRPACAQRDARPHHSRHARPSRAGQRQSALGDVFRGQGQPKHLTLAQDLQQRLDFEI
jgi:hypothetical protein